MFGNDWKIHKRLLDAGGLGDTVYICQGRGSCKTTTELEQIEELLAKGKTVIPVRLEYLNLSLNRHDNKIVFDSWNNVEKIQTKSTPVPDLDILEEDRLIRAEHIIECIREAQEKLKVKPRYIPEYELFKNFYVLDEDEPVWKKDNWPRPYPYWPFIYW